MESTSKLRQLTMKSSEQEEEEEAYLRAIEFSGASAVHAAFRAAIELKLFEIMMEKSGPDGYISALEIASHLSAQNSNSSSNPEAPAMIDRMLQLLASYSLLRYKTTTSSTRSGTTGDAAGTNIPSRLYGLTRMCKYFVHARDGVSSVSPTMLFVQDKVITDIWYHLKDAVTEGGIPFNRTHGMHLFEYMGKDSRFSELFNQAMSTTSVTTVKIITETYKGFEGFKEVVDVGGGFGTTLCSIISKYPHIKGINFDLPHVIKDAPLCPGVEHVGGDMFEAVPKGEVILLKLVLHDWTDDQCVKLLKNCREALPASGKVIAVEMILPEFPESDLLSKICFQFDMGVMMVTPGGKERTEKEYEVLATRAGFAASKLACRAHIYGILEFYKEVASAN